VERRLFVRINKESALKIAREGKIVEARMCDLGGEGAGVITETPLELNEKINLLFPFGEDELSLEGRVVWRKKLKEGWRIGINFISPRLLLVSHLLYS